MHTCPGGMQAFFEGTKYGAGEMVRGQNTDTSRGQFAVFRNRETFPEGIVVF